MVQVRGVGRFAARPRGPPPASDRSLLEDPPDLLPTLAPSQVRLLRDLHDKRKDTRKGCLFVCGAGKRSRTSMKLLSHGPEPCASANSAIPAEQYLYYDKTERKASTFLHALQNIYEGKKRLSAQKRTGNVLFPVRILFFRLSAVFRPSRAFYSMTLTFTTPSIAFSAAIKLSEGFLLTSNTV